MSVFTQVFSLCTIVILWATSFTPAQSQSYDVVYYSGGEAVHCDLIEVTDYTVRYRLHDLPDGEIYNELRDDIALIFRRNGDFLLPVESGVQWKSGSNPDYNNIVTRDSQVLAAHDIEEHEDIIYYHDALDSADGSIRTDEIVAIIYQEGDHRLFASVDEAAYALGGALAFAASANDAMVSTESMAAPLSEDSLDESPSTIYETDNITLEEEDSLSEFPSASDGISNIPSEEEVMAEVETPSGETIDSAELEEAPFEEEIEEQSSIADLGTEEEEGEQIEYDDPNAETEEATTEAGSTDKRTALQEDLELSDTDYEEFAAKAVNKAEYLNNYLSLLCNRTLDIYDKEQAKESALKLFVHDSTIVQVSSLHNEEIEKYTIDQYLEHLTLFDYDKVELLWRNVQYVTKFRLAPDGNYYGTITVEQVFRGLKDGRPIYEDITQKDIEIVLSNFVKEESGVTEYAWDVFLSDIGVEETRRL